MKKSSISVVLAFVMVIAFSASSWACDSCGCTPGYWKQDQHLGSWAFTGYSTDQFVSEVFGCGPDMTLLDALSAKNSDMMDMDDMNMNGGNDAALVRHAVAALLNAGHPAVASDVAPDMVIAMFCMGFGDEDWKMAKKALEDINERYCPLGLAPATDTPM